MCFVIVDCFFFKQKTAYEMRISDWSSDVCSSDLTVAEPADRLATPLRLHLPPRRGLQESSRTARADAVEVLVRGDAGHGQDGQCWGGHGPRLSKTALHACPPPAPRPRYAHPTPGSPRPHAPTSPRPPPPPA